MSDDKKRSNDNDEKRITSNENEGEKTREEQKQIDDNNKRSDKSVEIDAKIIDLVKRLVMRKKSSGNGTGEEDKNKKQNTAVEQRKEKEEEQIDLDQLTEEEREAIKNFKEIIDQDDARMIDQLKLIDHIIGAFTISKATLLACIVDIAKDIHDCYSIMSYNREEQKKMLDTINTNFKVIDDVLNMLINVVSSLTEMVTGKPLTPPKPNLKLVVDNSTKPKNKG